MSEWKEYKLGELIQTNKRSINSDYQHKEIEYLDTGSITKGKIDSFQKYKLSDAPSRAKRLVKQDDIIYSTVRPIQRHYGFIDNPLPNLVVSTGFVTITCEKDILYPKFLYYFLSNDVTVEYLDVIAEASTSAYPSLRPLDIENLEITIPELTEQKSIASVLSSLDDKIDLLHRQNATLEKMAETLFRKWFVEEEKEEWESKQLKEVTDIAIGRTPPRKESKWFSTNPKDVKWISIKDLGDDGVFISITSEYLTKEAVETFNIPMIPKDTVVLSFKMTVGRVAITFDEMLSNEAIAHFKFNNKTPFSKEYLYMFLKTYRFETLGSTSSIVVAINSTMIKEMEILIPDEFTIQAFKDEAELLFNKIKSNQTQIQTLTALRDTLLPKLMSGEVRVSGN